MSFAPQFVDPYLGDGGVLLDSSDFIDIELSTVGVSSMTSITLSIYGRSFDTTASGSFNWQTFEGTGGTPSGFVSNVAPYEWYSTDVTSGMSAGNGNVLLRIKSGPPSDSLVSIASRSACKPSDRTCSSPLRAPPTGRRAGLRRIDPDRSTACQGQNRSQAETGSAVGQ